MIKIASVEKIQSFVSDKKSKSLTIGFVPTMGALHEGHISLVNRSKSECDLTIVSIFINPTQFNDVADFEKYPRILDQDAKMLETVQCDVLFIPDVHEMYNSDSLIIDPIDLGYLDTILEGIMRPGHYAGVATIVEKLFGAVTPDRVYMGLKDYQQVKVVEKIIRDRGLKIELIGCPTQREENGLAMSSRNLRLSKNGLDLSTQLFKSLSELKKSMGTINPKEALEKAIRSHIKPFPIKLEYLELRNAHDLSEVELNHWDPSIHYVALIAAWVEDVRLIDNLELNPN